MNLIIDDIKRDTDNMILNSNTKNFKLEIRYILISVCFFIVHSELMALYYTRMKLNLLTCNSSLQFLHRIFSPSYL